MINKMIIIFNAFEILKYVLSNGLYLTLELNTVKVFKHSSWISFPHVLFQLKTYWLKGVQEVSDKVSDQVPDPNWPLDQ